MCVSIKGSHLRPRHTAPLYYLMGHVWAPQTRVRKAASANPTAHAPRTLMGEARRQDLGAPMPYQWRERAKPLEGRVAVAAAHVGCCVLCCVVCCDSSKFSYHPGSNTISANSKWPIFARSCHKIGQQTPQLQLDVQTCHHSEMLH
jgi:hypothetical protein